MCLPFFCSSTFISFSYVVSPGYKMNKCVGAIEEFEFLPLRSGKHLHLTIAVTGWLCSGKYSKYGFCCFTTTTTDSFHWLGVDNVDKSKPAEMNWTNYNYIPQFLIRLIGVLVPVSTCSWWNKIQQKQDWPTLLALHIYCNLILNWLIISMFSSGFVGGLAAPPGRFRGILDR